MDQIRLEMDQKLVFLYQKKPFYGGNFVCGTYAFGGNNSE